MKSAPYANDGIDPLSPLVRLWILRVLVNLGGHAKLFPRDRSGLDLHGILPVDLVHWFEDDIELKPRQALAELRRKLKAEESNDVEHTLPSPLAENAQSVAALLGLTEIERRILEFVVEPKNE